MPPMPKRSSERRRRNREGLPVKAAATGRVVVPTCPAEAHPIARRWYLSLKRSGQSQYFEPSDWAAALLVVAQLSRLLASDDPIPASAFAVIWAGMASLLTTEGDRRRARVEVERAPAQSQQPPAGVSAIEDYRKRMAQ